MSLEVNEIVELYLHDHGYQGLYNSELECGCALDGVGLGPCYDGINGGCQCAYKHNGPFIDDVTGEPIDIDFFMSTKKDLTREERIKAARECYNNM